MEPQGEGHEISWKKKKKKKKIKENEIKETQKNWYYILVGKMFSLCCPLISHNPKRWKKRKRKWQRKERLNSSSRLLPSSTFSSSCEPRCVVPWTRSWPHVVSSRLSQGSLSFLSFLFLFSFFSLSFLILFPFFQWHLGQHVSSSAQKAYCGFWSHRRQSSYWKPLGHRGTASFPSCRTLTHRTCSLVLLLCSSFLLETQDHAPPGCILTG